MSKIFLAYRFTGEDPSELSATLGRIISTLRDVGHEVYCSIEDEDWFRGNKHSNKDIMEHAFKKLEEYTTLLAFIRSDQKSEGMLLEIGYVLGKGRPFVLALKSGVYTTSISEMASPLIEFTDIDDLCEKLRFAVI